VIDRWPFKPRLSPEQRVERDKKILDDVRAGLDYYKVGRKYKLSRTRVRQIVERARDPPQS
jgi:Mor family transcriptional regulator